MSAVAGGRIPLERRAGSPGDGPYPIGLIGILATVVMLFAAFTAALLVRRSGTDWIPVPLPPVVWANTVVLVASSAAIEFARRAVRDGRPGAPTWLAAAAALGVLFLGGQIVAWDALADRGVFLATNPHAAFFFLLSALHGAHVVGGLGALAWTLQRAACGAYTRTGHSGLVHTAIYWHVVAVVWLYLLVVLSTF